MKDKIWDEKFIERNPKLAAQAIEFLQEMLRTQESEADFIESDLQNKIDVLELEMQMLKEKYETNIQTPS